jgi:predicted membrane GTPase involved in stress response
MYYEYPIEQLARSPTTRFQMGFAKMTMNLMPTFEDVVLEPSVQGLKILGASEMALASPGEVIRQIHSNEVELREPRVRLLYGMKVREPVMWVRASARHKYAEAVVQDLVTRGAAIEEVDWLVSQPVVLAKAPLRSLLGYPQVLATLSQNTAQLKMWLSHYAPMSSGPDNNNAA